MLAGGHDGMAQSAQRLELGEVEEQDVASGSDGKTHVVCHLQTECYQRPKERSNTAASSRRFCAAAETAP